jgi:hypothetical protein
MAKKIILSGILAIALVFAMTVLGCENAPEDDGGNTITITGITQTSTERIMMGISVGNNLSSTASAKGKFQILEGNSITFSLYDFQKSDVINSNYIPWKEKGDFIIQLEFKIGNNLSTAVETYYLYTDGKTWNELGVNNKPTVAEMDTKLPRYTISSSKSTIAFSKFQDQPSIK